MWSKAPLVTFVWIALVASAFQAQDQSNLPDPVLIVDSEGSWKLVRAHCTSCHSSQIFKNLRLSRDAWQDVIRRMQSDEGLWELGESEAKILDYLETHFGPQADSPKRRSRRAPISPRIQTPPD